MLYIMKHVSYSFSIKYSKTFDTNKIFCTKIGIPVVYSLLPDRKTPTYIYLFNVLFSEAKRLDKTFNPSLIMTDFEPGTAKAISLKVSSSLNLSSLDIKDHYVFS
jgi:hypothetical protein